MTPAEWLAWIMLGSGAISVVRDLVDPDEITLRVRSNFWKIYLFVLLVVQLTLAVIIVA